MTHTQMQEYLHKQIPLSKAMGIEVNEIQEGRVVLEVPLEPNINHRATAFGGSISAAAILACWTLLHMRLNAVIDSTRLVIHKNKMVYRKPISGRFQAMCALPGDSTWPDFMTMLEQHNKAKIILCADIIYDNEKAGEFTGSFVAMKD
jgi:thioesterase domain-containing protein